jgi:propanediol dehydratase small subunit
LNKGEFVAGKRAAKSRQDAILGLVGRKYAVARSGQVRDQIKATKGPQDLDPSKVVMRLQKSQANVELVFVLGPSLMRQQGVKNLRGRDLPLQKSVTREAGTESLVLSFDIAVEETPVQDSDLFLFAINNPPCTSVTSLELIGNPIPGSFGDEET